MKQRHGLGGVLTCAFLLALLVTGSLSAQSLVVNHLDSRPDLLLCGSVHLIGCVEPRFSYREAGFSLALPLVGTVDQ
jgi:hypothetical protein